MKEQDIQQGNKAIAEFMGAKWIEDDFKAWGYSFDRPPTVVTKFHLTESLKYHSSWDWLMPVVEKMYSLKYTMIIDAWAGCEAYSYSTGFTSNPIITVDRDKNESLIECVWQAVIQFIQWYNNQQKQVKE